MTDRSRYQNPANSVTTTFAAGGKVGATAGWTGGAAANTYLATLPQSQTASTLIIPVSAPQGSLITGFALLGQIESAGNAVTIDADLRVHTVAAANIADASVGTITQVAVSADTAMSAATAGKTGLSHTVDTDEMFYVKISGTTAATTDVALMGVSVTVTPA